METDKLARLKSILAKYNSAIIAFSGGVDSTFLAKVASENIKKVLLVTATSESFPFYELEEAKELARLLNLKHRIIVTDEMKVAGYKNNSPDRCYYCKNELFDKIVLLSENEGFEVAFYGSNYDDNKDYRPGRKAAKEKQIISPLADAGMTKKDIRSFSEYYHLPTSNKPALACLASRIPYGEEITKEKLDRISITEYNLKQLGFKIFRVRSHENLARLEFAKEEIDRAWQMKDQLIENCKSTGFKFVSIDLEGYKSGSLNKSINIK
jgi:uncharacterized protein